MARYRVKKFASAEQQTKELLGILEQGSIRSARSARHPQAGWRTAC